jgi:hypothetical protein
LRRSSREPPPPEGEQPDELERLVDQVLDAAIVVALAEPADLTAGIERTELALARLRTFLRNPRARSPARNEEVAAASPTLMGSARP